MKMEIDAVNAVRSAKRARNRRIKVFLYGFASCRCKDMATLFHKVWDAHSVRRLPSGQTQLFVGLHLIHEVTSPQAFDMLRQHGLRVPYPDRTFATVDHIVPTSTQRRPFLDVTAEEMTVALERNCRDFGIQLFAPGGTGGENQGIVHVIGPQL